MIVDTTVDVPVQACWLDDDEEMPWDFGINPEGEDNPDLDRPVLAYGSSGLGQSENFLKFVLEARAFCEAFDLLVADPQGEDFRFVEPSAYLVLPEGFEG